MRYFHGFVFGFTMLLGSVSQASDKIDIDKMKTGILPSGGFYSLYNVQCSGQLAGSIAHLKDDRRWCTLDGGAMQCYSRLQDASLSVCMAGAVAVTDDDVDKDGSYK